MIKRPVPLTLTARRTPVKAHLLAHSLSTKAGSAGPRGRSDLRDGVIGFAARQIGVDGSELGFNEWSASTIEAPVRTVTGHLDSSRRTFCGTE